MSILQFNQFKDEEKKNKSHWNFIKNQFISEILSNYTAEATNLFLRENGIEVLRAMQPQLQKKLSAEFASIANQLLKHVPRESFLID